MTCFLWPISETIRILDETYSAQEISDPVRSKTLESWKQIHWNLPGRFQTLCKCRNRAETIILLGTQKFLPQWIQMEKLGSLTGVP